MGNKIISMIKNALTKPNWKDWKTYLVWYLGIGVAVATATITWPPQIDLLFFENFIGRIIIWPYVIYGFIKP